MVKAKKIDVLDTTEDKLNADLEAKDFLENQKTQRENILMII